MQPDSPVTHLDPYQKPKVMVKVKKRKDRELVGAIHTINLKILSLAASIA